MTNLSSAMAAALAVAAVTAGAPALPAATDLPSRAVIFFGDSLTAGYGVEREQAYPALIQRRIEEESLPFAVVNAGLSGETTAAGVRRISWILRQPAAVLVLALGGNDGLRGVPPEETERNLQSIIDTVRRVQPEARVVLTGMQSPPNMGPEFTAAFRAIFPRLAAANALPLVPFLLEGVGGEPALNLPDGIHPNPEGHAVIADNVWPALEPLLRKMAGDQLPSPD